jgi:hypothetical protein
MNASNGAARRFKRLTLVSIEPHRAVPAGFDLFSPDAHSLTLSREFTPDELDLMFGKWEGLPRVEVLPPAGALDAGAVIGKALALAKKIEAINPKLSVTLTLDGTCALRGLSAWLEAPEATAARDTDDPALGLTLDEGRRCAGHALNAADCVRNAPWREIAPSFCKRWEEKMGGSVSLRFQADNPAYGFGITRPCFQRIQADLDYAAAMGFAGVEWLDSPSDAFAAKAFMELALSGESAAFAALKPEYRAYLGRLEEAHDLALRREAPAAAESLDPLELRFPPANELYSAEIPEALDFSGDELSVQDEAARRFDRVYELLDECKQFADKDAILFKAQELKLELLGTLRALYAEAYRPDGSPGGLSLMADMAILHLRKAIEGLLPEGQNRLKALLSLECAHGVPVGILLKQDSHTLFNKARAGIFNSMRRSRYAKYLKKYQALNHA